MYALTRGYNDLAATSAMAREEFQAGLKYNDLERVEYGMALGATASRTPMHSTDLRNPLIPYLQANAHSFGAASETAKELISKRPNIEQIVQKLLNPENGKFGVPAQDYLAHDGRDGRLAEAVLKDMTGKYKDASPWVSIVTGQAVRLISQSKNADLNFNEVFAARKDVDPHQRYTAISQVINEVRKRIEDPQTNDEKFGYLNYRKELRAWGASLNLPPKMDAIRLSLAMAPALKAVG